MGGGERGPEAYRSASEENVLDGGEERLKLGLPSPRPARDEEMHGHLVKMIREMERRLEHAAPLVGEVGCLRGLDGRCDVVLERAPVPLRDPRASLRLGDRDEDPGLTVSAARCEGPRLAHLADELGRNRV